MPRDLSKSEEMSSRCNRYSPLGRRSPLAMPTPPISPPVPVPAATRRYEERRNDLSDVRRCPAAETPMSMFHAQVVEKLHEKLENRELELASDAETLTADEGPDSSNDSWSSLDSWSSRDSWSSQDSWGSLDSYGSMASRDSSGNIYLYGRPPAPRTPEIVRQFESVYPRVLVLPIPQLDVEPMEIVVEEQPAPAPQLQAFHQPDAVVESDDDDDASETSSIWFSDEDEEVHRVCLAETDEESDEDLDEMSSGRVNRPQVDYPEYYIPRSEPPSPGYQQEVLRYWQVGQLEPSQGQLAPVSPQEQQFPIRENSVELMDQDDEDSNLEPVNNAVIDSPARPVIQHDAQAQHHLVVAQGPIQGREISGLNNNYVLAGTYARHPINRCNHCGSPRQETLHAHQVDFFHQEYLAQLEDERNVDRATQYVLYPDNL